MQIGAVLSLNSKYSDQKKNSLSFHGNFTFTSGSRRPIPWVHGVHENIWRTITCVFKVTLISRKSLPTVIFCCWVSYPRYWNRISYCPGGSANSKRPLMSVAAPAAVCFTKTLAKARAVPSSPLIRPRIPPEWALLVIKKNKTRGRKLLIGFIKAIDVIKVVKVATKTVGYM